MLTKTQRERERPLFSLAFSLCVGRLPVPVAGQPVGCNGEGSESRRPAQRLVPDGLGLTERQGGGKTAETRQTRAARQRLIRYVSYLLTYLTWYVRI